MTTMNKIQKGVLQQFRRQGIRCLVIGGQAMRAYGMGRDTRDLDLWIARDLANAQAMIRFLHRVQNRPPIERLQEPNFKFTVGNPSSPDVDILTSVAGDPSFEEAFERRLQLMLDGTPMDVVAESDLLRIKAAAAEKNEADAAGGNLSAEERLAAEGAARKDRFDVALLRMWIGAA